MNATGKLFQTIPKFIAYAGAVACCLAGLGQISIVIAILRVPNGPDGPYLLFLWAIFICLAFTPALMILTGVRTKTWHWVIIAIVEVIALTVALWVLADLVELESGYGE